MKISHTDNSRPIMYRTAMFLIAVSVLYFFFADSLRPYFANGYTRIYNRLFHNDSTLAILEGRIDELENQNANLRNMLREASLTEDFINHGQVGLVQSSIVFNVPPMMYNELLLNSGETSGVVPNALVFVRGLNPIGFISDVFSDSSKVTLFSKRDIETEGVIVLKSHNAVIPPNTTSTTPVTTSEEDMLIDLEVTEPASTTPPLPVITTSDTGEQTIGVIVRGDGAYGLVASLSDVFEVTVGDLVYLKSNPDYAFGTISHIIPNQNEKMNNLYIKSFYEPNTGHYLYIER